MWSPARASARLLNSTADPITVIDPELSAREGKLDTASTLQSSPIAAGSTQITAAISSNFVTNGGPGAQTIDLRGLGANRTLVLLNGRRAGPAGTRGGVSSFDLNVLPQSIAENVQILKTGASSVYGSDAVAGVVNFKIDHKLQGVRGNAQYGISDYGDNKSYLASIAAGTKFAQGRGHIIVGAEAAGSKGILDYGAREVGRLCRHLHHTRRPTANRPISWSTSRGPRTAPMAA